jgi:hypothetical protein
MFFWDIGILVTLPSGDIMRVSIKWSSITTFWLKEYHGVIGFNSANE